MKNINSYAQRVVMVKIALSGLFSHDRSITFDMFMVGLADDIKWKLLINYGRMKLP